MEKGRDAVRVFLSYASEDINDVYNIYNKLIEKGFSPWMDKKNLLPGQNWKNAITQAIKNAHFIIIFFSHNSISKRGFVQREFKLALDVLNEIPENQIYIIPVRLDDCKIPNNFSSIQYCDLFEDGSLERIISTITVGAEQLGILTTEHITNSELEKMDVSQLELRYLGLKALIESGNGRGFHNADMGHPVYRAGSKGRTDIGTWGDSPERNKLYKELSSLSKELKNRGVGGQHYVWWYDFSEWRDFCKFAIGVYEKKVLGKK